MNTRQNIEEELKYLSSQFQEWEKRITNKKVLDLFGVRSYYISYLHPESKQNFTLSFNYGVVDLTLSRNAETLHFYDSF